MKEEDVFKNDIEETQEQTTEDDKNIFTTMKRVLINIVIIGTVLFIFYLIYMYSLY